MHDVTVCPVCGETCFSSDVAKAILDTIKRERERALKIIDHALQTSAIMSDSPSARRAALRYVRDRIERENKTNE